MMKPVERVLFVANRAAGVGHAATLIDQLAARLKSGLAPGVELQTEPVSDHAGASKATQDFLRAGGAPALVIAGGGGGTLRAVIEGLCRGCSAGKLPPADIVRVGALRMGSGNVLAKQFGVPRDPFAGLDGLLQSLKAGRTAPCCIMRCELNNEVFHAATLGGFGQFGCVPGDLAVRHKNWPRLHRLFARTLGIERLTNVEYALSLLRRSCRCALFTKSMESIEVHVDGGQSTSMRLLSGALLNFRLPALPFQPEISVEDAALSLQLIPFRRRFDALALVLMPRRLSRKAVAIRIDQSTAVELRLTDRPAAAFFLDEDPHEWTGTIKLMVAGLLAFVPGPEYRNLA